jgi:hypothetical protein
LGFEKEAENTGLRRHASQSVLHSLHGLPIAQPVLILADISDFLTALTGRRLVYLLILLAGLFSVYYGVVHTLPANTQKLDIHGVGSIVLSQPTPGGGQEYLVVVHPQGWQETAIAVKAGDTLTFDAGGNIYIDLGGLNESLALRRKLEAQLVQNEKKSRKWPAEKATLTPEDRFTMGQKASIRPVWSWNGPNGNVATQDLSFPARRQKTIIATANYGTLLGAIRETGISTPDRHDAFIVGAHRDGFTVKESGKLYFTVNDVWDDKDPTFPEKFYIDNIGSFYVKVTVTPAKISH